MPRKALLGEIVVLKGDYSYRICTEQTDKILYLLNPRGFQSEFSNRMCDDTMAKNQDDMDAIFSAFSNSLLTLQMWFITAEVQPT